SVGKSLYIQSPVHLFNQENSQTFQSFSSLTGGNVLDIAFDPISTKIPYLIEGQSAPFEFDILTGQSGPLPLMDALGMPLALKPQRMVIGGPDRNLYILEANQISKFSRKGQLLKQIPTRVTLRSMTYNSFKNQLDAFDPATNTLYQFSANLDLLTM